MGHAFRGAVTAWLSLIVLQTVATKGGTGRVAGLFDDANRLVKRALDPNVAAIPDRSHPQPTLADTSQATPFPTGQHTPFQSIPN